MRRQQNLVACLPPTRTKSLCESSLFGAREDLVPSHFPVNELVWFLVRWHEQASLILLYTYWNIKKEGEGIQRDIDFINLLHNYSPAAEPCILPCLTGITSDRLKFPWSGIGVHQTMRKYIEMQCIRDTVSNWRSKVSIQIAITHIQIN